MEERSQREMVRERSRQGATRQVLSQSNPAKRRPGAAMLAAVVLAAVTASEAPSAAWAEAGPETELSRSAQLCARLGDRLRGKRDRDVFSFEGRAGERVRIEVSPRGPGDDAERIARLRLRRRGGGLPKRGPHNRSGTLPLAVETVLPSDGSYRVRLLQGPVVGERRLDARYCLKLASSQRAWESLAVTRRVEVEWLPLAEGASALPPFERREGAGDGRIQPLFPLRDGRVYGLIVTTRVRSLDGRSLEASPAFRRAAGAAGEAAGGPVALWSEDPEDEGNPFPEARLVGADGRIWLPDRVVLAGLDPENPALDAARAHLRQSASDMARLKGFNTTAPVHVALSEAVDLATLTPENVLFFERTNGRLGVDKLLREARRHGVDPDEVALAISFPTQRIAPDMRLVRDRLAERALRGDFDALLDDPDPEDDLPIGVFDRNAGAGAPFADFLADSPEVAAVVAGLVLSPDFRDADGTFDSDLVEGEREAPAEWLEFKLTLPADAEPPYPVVIVQHGFTGNNSTVLDMARALASHGLAAIGIDAVVHGRRGNPMDLLAATPLQARDVFRQSVADQMALLRSIERGIDVDGDGEPDLRPEGVGYIGISFGGLLGSVLAGAEDALGPAVLNVAGGRAALLGQSPGLRLLVAPTLADVVGLTVGSPEFEAYLPRLLELGSLSQNAADPLNWARRWSTFPFPGRTPRPVLLQQGEGDTLVINAFTEELAAVAGMATNTPASDPSGVSGHWIFEGPEGHGIIGREDVREQAAVFLASGGTQLIEP